MKEYICNIAIKVRNESGDWYPLPILRGLPGMNAYELAVSQGYSGSLQQWLVSLKGEPGIQGIQGIPGVGITGPQGNFNDFIFRRTATQTIPSTPVTSQSDTAPAGWSLVPLGVDSVNKYEWACKRTKVSGVWGNYSAPALWAVYAAEGTGGGTYVLPQATNLILGGVRAAQRGEIETVEVKIDTLTGKLYVPPSSGTGGGIADVVSEQTPKYYARLSSNPPIWAEVLPPQGSVGTLQQVTGNGATTNVQVALQGGAVIDALFVIPNTEPESIPEGRFAMYMDAEGYSGTLPGGGSGYTLPIASALILGGVKVGTGLAISEDGVLSVTAGEGGFIEHTHPTSEINGLDITLGALGYDIYLLGQHLSDSLAHSSLFAAKANKNGSATEDFAAKDISAAGKVTMVENINTNLRIPKAAPVNPVEGEWYLYME